MDATRGFNTYFEVNEEITDFSEHVPENVQNELDEAEALESGSERLISNIERKEEAAKVHESTFLRSSGAADNDGNYFVVDQQDSQYLEDQFSSLNETIYTILYMSKPRTVSFVFASAVFLLQWSLILLVAFDTLSLSTKENKWKIPANVDLTVHVAQGLIIIFMVAFQQDFVEAVIKFHNGPHQNFISDPQTGASAISFYGSTIAQMATGCSLLVTIFILTMQAETVLSMMLNFAALHFLSDLDDLSFRLAKFGFVDNRIELEIRRILTYQVRDRGIGKPKLVRRALFFVLVGLLFFGFGWVKYYQAKGMGLCDRIYVQFGDTFNPKLAQFSGVYTPQDRVTFYRRDYVDLITKQNILLSYCGEEQRWTFTTMVEGVDSEAPCKKILARSPRVIAYDVTAIPNSGWSVRNELLEKFVAFGHFVLICLDENTAKTDESALPAIFTDTPCEEIQVDGRSSMFPRLSQGMGLAAILLLLISLD